MEKTYFADEEVRALRNTIDFLKKNEKKLLDKKYPVTKYLENLYEKVENFGK